MKDAVFWGSIITVIGGIGILGFLAYKVSQLIKRDAQAHKR